MDCSNTTHQIGHRIRIGCASEERAIARCQLCGTRASSKGINEIGM